MLRLTTIAPLLAGALSLPTPVAAQAPATVEQSSALALAPIAGGDSSIDPLDLPYLSIGMVQTLRTFDAQVLPPEDLERGVACGESETPELCWMGAARRAGATSLALTQLSGPDSVLVTVRVFDVSSGTVTWASNRRCDQPCSSMDVQPLMASLALELVTGRSTARVPVVEVGASHSVVQDWEPQQVRPAATEEQALGPISLTATVLPHSNHGCAGLDRPLSLGLRLDINNHSDQARTLEIDLHTTLHQGDRLLVDDRRDIRRSLAANTPGEPQGLLTHKVRVEFEIPVEASNYEPLLLRMDWQGQALLTATLSSPLARGSVQDVWLEQNGKRVDSPVAGVPISIRVRVLKSAPQATHLLLRATPKPRLVFEGQISEVQTLLDNKRVGPTDLLWSITPKAGATHLELETWLGECRVDERTWPITPAPKQ